MVSKAKIFINHHAYKKDVAGVKKRIPCGILLRLLIIQQLRNP
jgi:hypothetical protein